MSTNFAAPKDNAIDPVMPVFDDISIRPWQAQDEEAVLSMNQKSVQQLSALDQPRLQQLAAISSKFWVAQQQQRLCGFLLAFEQGSTYDSSNYQWFDQRYPRFIYVDRIVIDADFRGMALGQRFYQRLVDYARAQHIPAICAEVDLEPANPASLKFHRQQGFVEVGQRQYGTPQKTVSLLRLECSE